MIKGAKRNPYKCMNVMKQYAMDDKIIERCKTHTHTKQVSPILYFKNKSRQFSEYTLTHVNLYDGQITLYMHMYQEQQRILRVVCKKTSQDCISVYML